jgi:hypothetical protein
MMKRRCYRIFPLFLVLFLVACTDAYRTAARGAQTVAVSIGEYISNVDADTKTGLISPSEEKNLIVYADVANKLNGQYTACVQMAGKATTAPVGFIACASTLRDGLSDPTLLASLHVSNPTSQAKAKLWTNTVIAAAQGIITALQSIKGGA